jgi:peptide methionine sulfoxide reductase MsrB
MHSDRAGKLTRSDEEWKKALTLEQYRVTRQHGTERAFSNPLNHEKRAGMFKCVCCGAPLFASDTKFDSGTSVPIPKFAHLCGALRCELRNQRDTSNSMILVPLLNPKFATALPAR